MVINKNEDGYTLIISLVVLLLLTVLGILGTNITLYELQLAGNDKWISKLKINAESTAVAASEIIEHQPYEILRDSNWDSQTRLPWFSRGENDLFDTIGSEKYELLKSYTQDHTKWVDDPNYTTNCALLLPEKKGEYQKSFRINFPDCKFQVIDTGVARGSSLQTGNNFTNLHELIVSGLSSEAKGRCLVQIGYRKRF